jgi:ketosteroid isomerase-like protein
MADVLSKAQGFYGLALIDPVAAATQYPHTDFVLKNLLPTHIPFGGRYDGLNGFLTYLGTINAAIKIGPLRMDEWVADCRTVAVRGEEQSVVRATGRTYRMCFVHWLSFDAEGKITAMRKFNDTAEMAEAFDL